MTAEPLYVLADTAVVGHLGTTQLAGLAVATEIILAAYALFIFLAYGTTGTVARLLGAGNQAEAARQAVQGLWLALAVGLALTTLGVLAGPWLVGAMGATGRVRADALLYLRVSLAGFPALLLTMAGTGYLRGLQDTRTPLVVAVTTSVANLVLEIVLISGFGFGLGASALTTVVVQWCGTAVYLATVLRATSRFAVAVRPDWPALRRQAAVGGNLLVRTAALRGALVLSTAVATRLGPVSLGAHQIAFQLWSFTALALDALAIAAQAMIGRLLGGSDPDGARAASQRMLQWGVAAGSLFAVAILPLHRLLPHLFSGDHRVVALTGFLLWFVALLQPVNALAFVLDGVLIGAGDLRFLAWAMFGAALLFGASAGSVLAFGLGIGWLWAAIGLLMVTRAVTLGLRFSGGRWLVEGATTG